MTVNFDDIIRTSILEAGFLQIFQNAFSQQEQLFLEAHRTILKACYNSPGLSPALKAKTPEALALN